MSAGNNESLPPRKTRDHRVDALRGVALLMMLIDHTPQNTLNRFTLRHIGFADAAEIFVMLAGYASWLAYGRRILRGPPDGGWGSTSLRILRRCWRLYLFQIGMLAASLVTIKIWRLFRPVPVDYLEPELAHGYEWVSHALTLQALPSNLNILPVYIVLLLCFPLFVYLWKISPLLLASASLAVWSCVALDPAINFPNWLDPDGWYLNPFAWQFIFILGMLAAISAGKNEGSLHCPVWLRVLAIGVLGFNLVECFPYESWGLPSLRPLAHVPYAAKSDLAFLRWTDAAAILLLVQSSKRATAFSTTWLGKKFALFGRHSLEVFSFGTIVDLYGRLVFDTFGTSWPCQILINGIGFLIVYAVALWFENHRRETALMAGKSRSEARLEERTPISDSA